MKVAVLGGTGDMGSSVAKRLARSNTVVIGSRDAAKADEAARKVEGASGDDYDGASRDCEVAIVAVPFSAIDAIGSLSDALAGKLVVSMVNPLKMEGGLLRFALETGSAAERIAAMLPESSVSTAFNNLPSGMLEGESPVEADVLVAASSKEAYDKTAALVRSVRNLRPLHAGPLSQAQIVERITPLVLNLARLNAMPSLAPRFVSKNL